jgi:agmatine deiminase
MNRRNVFTPLAAGAALAGYASTFAALAAGPESAKFRMPDEGEPHERTWMGFTSSGDIWGKDLPGVQQDLMRIADAIAQFEPVSMLVNGNAMARAEKLRAGAAQQSNIQLVAASLDDLWLRDTGPVIVRRVGGRELRALDFNFNGWGQKQEHRRDAKIAGFVAARAGLPIERSAMVLEGGGIEVDGEGTAIVKESCVLNRNRNPGLSRTQAEKVLSANLGLTKIIWLPGPAGGDITDAHTDFYARFAGEGRVVVSHDANDTYGEQAVTQRHIAVLKKATDAKGRTLSLTIIPVPEQPDAPKASSDTFAAGYINYYLCNAGLILPAFGDAAADKVARTALQSLYPNRRVVPLRTDAISAGGGGIHCATQQQPKA